MPLLDSLQVGLPHTYPASTLPSTRANAASRPWRTAFFKEPVQEPLWLSKANLAGDYQANRKYHGGPDKALLAYAAEHYPHWRAELQLPALRGGGFGENLTLSGLNEHTVCLGDIYAIGETQVQVSQPRQPCQNIARRWQLPELTNLVQATGRTGWYLRVLQEGYLFPGQVVTLLERSCPDWTIALLNDLRYQRQRDLALLAELAASPLLNADWRQTFAARLKKTPS